MNAPVQTQPVQRPQLKPMQAFVKGRIDAVRRNGSNWYTRLLTPAEDEYSRPQTLEIRSVEKIGSKGEEVTVTVKLGGFTRKPFRYTDKETGEVLTLVPVDHTLDAVG